MEHFKEVPDVNRLIISPLYLREGLEFAKNQGYNDILISTDDIGISGVSCKHTLNVSLICEYDFIETLIISGYDFTIEPCNLNQLSVLPHLKKLGLWIDKVFTIDFSLFPKLEELKYYHTKQTENVDTLINLKRLHIYNLKSEDLKELKSMNLLEELTLWDAKNINLNGLCQLTNIRTLEIVRSRKMIDIRGLCKVLIYISTLENHRKGWSREIPEPVFSIYLTFLPCIPLNHNPLPRHKRTIRFLRFKFSINH